MPIVSYDEGAIYQNDMLTKNNQYIMEIYNAIGRRLEKLYSTDAEWNAMTLTAGRVDGGLHIGAAYSVPYVSSSDGVVGTAGSYYAGMKLRLNKKIWLTNVRLYNQSTNKTVRIVRVSDGEEVASFQVTNNTVAYDCSALRIILPPDDYYFETPENTNTSGCYHNRGWALNAEFGSAAINYLGNYVGRQTGEPTLAANNIRSIMACSYQSFEGTSGNAVTAVYSPTTLTYWDMFIGTYDQSGGTVVFSILDGKTDEVLIADIKNGESIRDALGVTRSIKLKATLTRTNELTQEPVVYNMGVMYLT
jgi:hypothetical protein